MNIYAFHINPVNTYRYLSLRDRVILIRKMLSVSAKLGIDTYTTYKSIIILDIYLEAKMICKMFDYNYEQRFSVAEILKEYGSYLENKINIKTPSDISIQI